MASIRDYLEARSATPAGWNAAGDHLLVLSNLPGTMQIYELSMQTGELRQLTSEDEPVSGMYVPATDRVLVQRDVGGSERFQLYLLGDKALDPLVYDPAYMHVVGGMTRDGHLLAYSSNRRNGVDFDVYVRDLRTGDERCVYDAGGWCSARGFSPDGAWLAVSKPTEKSGDDELDLVGLESAEVVHVTPHDDEAESSGPAWLPDSSAFFFTTDIGRDVPALARYDMARRTWTYVLEPGWETSCSVDWTGRHLLLNINDEGFSRLELRDPKTLERTREVPLPGRGVVPTAVFSRDGRRLAFQFTSPLVPGDVWSFDTDSGELQRLTSSPSAVDASNNAEPELHRYRSFDDESVPLFWCQRPSRPTDADAPVVVYIHGGPESQSRPNWNPLIGYLVERGYAVAVPNVRGSTGYGKRYQHLDDRLLRLDSVADLAALHDWLMKRDGCDGSRAALFGGSYGGYMVLAGLAFQPERWAAGVDIVGISNLQTFLENTSAYRRRVREREYGFLDTDREFLIEASPLTHLERLRAPLFIIHGANDPRVPLSEAEQLYAAVKANGLRAELRVYDDEGHGLAKLKNRLDANPRAVDFLDDVLQL